MSPWEIMTSNRSDIRKVYCRGRGLAKGVEAAEAKKAGIRDREGQKEKERPAENMSEQKESK